MWKLTLALFPVIATTLMGICVVAVLTMDIQSTSQPIIYAALAGFVLSIPVSLFVGKAVVAKTGG